MERVDSSDSNAKRVEVKLHACHGRSTPTRVTCVNGIKGEDRTKSQGGGGGRGGTFDGEKDDDDLLRL